MSQKFSFTTLTENGAYPVVLMTVKDEVNNREYEVEVTLSWNGVTIKLPNQTSEEDEKSIVVDVWDGALCAYIYDNSVGEEPQKITIIPKLNHSLENNRVVAYEILKSTPYGKIVSISTENEERMTRPQLINTVKSLRERIKELETSETLLDELQRNE